MSMTLPSDVLIWANVDGSDIATTPSALSGMLSAEVPPIVNIYQISSINDQSFTVSSVRVKYVTVGDEKVPGMVVSEGSSSKTPISVTCCCNNKLLQLSDTHLLSKAPCDVQEIFGMKNCVTGNKPTIICRRIESWKYNMVTLAAIPNIYSVITKDFIPILSESY